MKKVNNKFLKSSTYINFDDEEIIAKYKELNKDNQSKEEYAKLAFEFVRDEIILPENSDKISIKASETLKLKMGISHSKSILLASLLRLNNIPCGICYQRLQNNSDERFVLHALNAIYLKKYGWFKIDSTKFFGENTAFVEFDPSKDNFAFKTGKDGKDGEFTDDYIYEEPFDYLVKIYERCKNFKELIDNLPDYY